jgi:hypothetical protein
MTTGDVCVAALKSVGFEVLEARDMALDARFGGDPWYWPLHPSNNPFSFRYVRAALLDCWRDTV